MRPKLWIGHRDVKPENARGIILRMTRRAKPIPGSVPSNSREVAKEALASSLLPSDKPRSTVHLVQLDGPNLGADRSLCGAKQASRHGVVIANLLAPNTCPACLQVRKENPSPYPRSYAGLL